jgi:hypothetical protein
MTTSAVVFASSPAGLSSGAGGGAALPQLSTMFVCAEAAPWNTMMAPNAAAARTARPW